MVTKSPPKPVYKPLELFDTDRLLDDHEREIASTVRRFVDTRLRANTEGWFESPALPKELCKEFGDFGLLDMHLDGYGCAGTNDRLGKLNNVREALAIARQLSHANSLESVLTNEGTSEMHLLSIGKALTGHAAFRS